MSEARYTPGPWAFDGESRIDAVQFRKQTTIKAEDGSVQPYMEGLVALPYPCYSGDDFSVGTHRANALLIAAAPTLYEAAMTALDALEQVTTSETFYRDPRGDNAGPAIDALRAALSKATQGEAR